MNEEEDFDPSLIIELMRVGYHECDILPFDLIDTTVSLLIILRVRNDKEFKLALGMGYYK